MSPYDTQQLFATVTKAASTPRDSMPTTKTPVTCSFEALCTTVRTSTEQHSTFPGLLFTSTHKSPEPVVSVSRHPLPDAPMPSSVMAG